MTKSRSQRGATTLEMTLVGIPIIFVLISVFEMSRGMWIYETLAHAAREGVRYAVVHGKTCTPAPPTITNSCSKTVQDIAAVIRNAGVGLDPESTLTFTADPGNVITCTLGVGSSSPCPATTWPQTNFNAPGQRIEIKVTTPFQSALAMFWPGAGSVSFSTVNLGASSADAIQF